MESIEPVNAKKAKNNLQHARRIRQTLEKVKQENDLPDWAFGPIPKPIQLVLKDKEVDINNQVYKYASERIDLLVKYLVEIEKKEEDNYINYMHEFIQEAGQEDAVDGDVNQNVVITMQNTLTRVKMYNICN